LFAQSILQIFRGLCPPRTAAGRWGLPLAPLQPKGSNPAQLFSNLQLIQPTLVFSIEQSPVFSLAPQGTDKEEACL
jgi:hypothetical protein